jgi:hypothetical protein
MNIEIKIVTNRNERCYNIQWPSELRIENCFRVTSIQVNNFKVTDVNSICVKDGNDVVVKFSESSPMRWMLKLKNEYWFNRVNIQ